MATITYYTMVELTEGEPVASESCTMTYVSPNRSSEVRLICDQSYDTPLFQPYGDINEQLKYVSAINFTHVSTCKSTNTMQEFDLTTKCACPGGCDGSTEPTDPNEPTDPTDPNHPTDNGEPSSTAAGVIGIVVMVL